MTNKLFYKTEEEIMKSWWSDDTQPTVSICCITYNHKDYIAQAIDGFLMQETNFPFEILIHDDASTDNTAEIIRKYEARYPKLIKPIYQIENQYSKGIKINPTLNFPRAQGEFIAICEGDDYWVDEHKLQHQVELLRNNADVNISFHPVYTRKENQLNKKLSWYGSKQCCFSLSEVIKGGGGFMPTCSLLIRRCALETLPDWFYKDAPVGDYYIQIFGALSKDALYMPNVYGVYRQNVPGSWSEKQKKLTKSEVEFEVDKHTKCLSELRRYGVSNDDVDFAIAKTLSSISLKALKNGYTDLSKEILSKSWMFKKGAGKQQVILKIFSCCLNALRFAIFIVSKFK